LSVLTAWWRGDLSLAAARSSGMVIEGRREWVRAFPTWFQRYVFADVASVREQSAVTRAVGQDSVPDEADARA
jgi:hypothetical protein